MWIKPKAHNLGPPISPIFSSVPDKSFHVVPIKAILVHQDLLLDKQGAILAY